MTNWPQSLYEGGSYDRSSAPEEQGSVLVCHEPSVHTTAAENDQRDGAGNPACSEHMRGDLRMEESVAPSQLFRFPSFEQ